MKMAGGLFLGNSGNIKPLNLILNHHDYELIEPLLYS